jgi:proline racemase
VAAPRDGFVQIKMDVPSGRVMARVQVSGGEVVAVAFRNVPSFVLARDVKVKGAVVDIAYGGAIYAFVPAQELGLRVRPEDLPALITAGREIKAALEGSEFARHPTDPRLSGIYGTVLYEARDALHRRNVVVFADCEVDRSPTGSATSALCALLADAGELTQEDVLLNESIIETSFQARVIDQSAEGVLTEVIGSAYRTGEHCFIFDSRDPLGTGFVLR